MRPAITYRRVSTERQAKEGLSLIAQKEQVQLYCKMRGWTIAKHFEDAGKSGRSRASRPGLQAAVKLACERKGVLVAYSLSRLARSVIDASSILVELQQAGADLAIVDMVIDTSAASGELIFNIFSAIAQFESQQIGERIKLSNDLIVKRLGHRTNGPQPAGYRLKSGKRVECPKELEVIQQARTLAETQGFAGAAKMLHDQGVPTIACLRGYKRKSVWNRQLVRDLLVKSPAGSAPHGSNVEG